MDYRMDFRAAFRAWLPLAIIVTGLCLLIYAAVQQNYRQSLDDPQIQMAEDAAQALAAGATPASVVPSTRIDIARSLAPYMIVYDESGKPVAFSGTLNGTPPVPPSGTFEFVRTKGAQGSPGEPGSLRYAARGEDRLTWEPEAGVRTAIVIDHVGGAKGGFVLAGRNMREVEGRIDAMSTMIGLMWSALLAATLIAQIFLHRFL